MKQIRMNSKKIRSRGLYDSDGRIQLLWRIMLGWLSFVIGLGAAVAVAQVAQSYEFPRIAIQLILAVVTTGIAIPLIYVLRQYADKRPWSGLGLSSPPSGLPYLILGVGLLAGSALLALVVGEAIGWLRVVELRLPVETLLVILINIPIAFFYEAFPEEVVFRGYLFRNLNTKFSRWLALLFQVVLFVLAPIALTAVMVAAGIGTWDLITLEYVINLIAFGTVLQLCRIYSGNLWMCIGFHIAWLEMVRYVIVPGSYAIIEVEYLSPYGYLLLSLGSTILAILIVLTGAYLRRKTVSWNERTPE